MDLVVPNSCRLSILSLALFVAVLASAGTQPTNPTAAAKVILITVDTLRADRLECYGYKKIKTPNINRLAAEGIRFSRAIAQVPLTLPSHCSILTGTHPVFHKVQDQTGSLPQERTTLAELLKARAFATAAFASSFVLDSRFGLDQGFDHYYDNFDNSRLASGDELERRGDQTLSAALAWMERSGRGNFFLWLHFYDPHAPYAPPEPFRTQYSEVPYDGEVAFIDSLIGRLVRFLEEKGWYSRTLLIFTSDHGEDLGDHGENTHGFFVYDSTVRIPLILKMPEMAIRGKIVDAQVQSVDITPSILQMLSFPTHPEIQGRSLVSLISGKQNRKIPALGETFYPLYHFGWSPLRFLRTERFKYIDAPDPEFYDLAQDPGETRNLFADRRSVANQLKEELLNSTRRFAPRAGSALSPRADVPPDQETIEKLKSLGYIGYGTRVPTNRHFGSLPDPKQKLAIYNRLQGAIADEQNRRIQQAIGKLNEITQLDSGVMDAYLHLGLAYKRLGQFENAIEQFQKALYIDPENSIATYNLAHTYALAGKIEEAVIGFRQTLRLDSRDSRAYVGLGIAYQLKGDVEKAKAEYRRALEINPVDSIALSNLAAALLGQGATQEAVRYLKQSLEINPDSAEAHNTLGSAYLIADSFDEAAARFREAVRLNPSYAEAHANLGLVFLKQGRIEEAISNLKRCVQINPSSGYAHHLLGQAFAAGGMHEAAQAEFREARRLGYP